MNQSLSFIHESHGKMAKNVSTHLIPILPSYLPETIIKFKVSWCFQGGGESGSIEYKMVKCININWHKLKICCMQFYQNERVYIMLKVTFLNFEWNNFHKYSLNTHSLYGGSGSPFLRDPPIGQACPPFQNFCSPHFFSIPLPYFLF